MFHVLVDVFSLCACFTFIKTCEYIQHTPRKRRMPLSSLVRHLGQAFGERQQENNRKHNSPFGRGGKIRSVEGGGGSSSRLDARERERAQSSLVPSSSGCTKCDVCACLCYPRRQQRRSCERLTTKNPAPRTNPRPAQPSTFPTSLQILRSCRSKGEISG